MIHAGKKLFRKMVSWGKDLLLPPEPYYEMDRPVGLHETRLGGRPGYRGEARHREDPSTTWKELREIVKEKNTKRGEKEVWFLVGRTLVRVKITAAKRDLIDEFARFEARVLEIEGVPVSEEERDIKMECFESSTEHPTPADQYEVISRVLANYGLHGRPVQVTDEYVSGHLRVLTLRQRVGERR